MVFIPGELDEVKGKRIAEEKTDKNGYGKEKRAKSEKLILIKARRFFEKGQDRTAGTIPQKSDANDQEGKVVILGDREISGQSDFQTERGRRNKEYSGQGPGRYLRHRYYIKGDSPACQRMLLFLNSCVNF